MKDKVLLLTIAVWGIVTAIVSIIALLIGMSNVIGNVIGVSILIILFQKRDKY